VAESDGPISLPEETSRFLGVLKIETSLESINKCLSPGLEKCLQNNGNHHRSPGREEAKENVGERGKSQGQDGGRGLKEKPEIS